MRHRLFRMSLALAPLVAVALFSTGCPSDTPAPKQEELISSRSYSGHENDQDANYFVRAYPAALGSRLDDCQLCHHAGVAGTSTGTGNKAINNPCNYCHLRPFPDSSYTTGVPASYRDTLNQFGMDYMDNGRSQAAFAAIADRDSDGDGSTNAVEIADNRYPGSASSKPGQPLAATVTLTQSQVAGMTPHSEFLLLNASKQQYDFYATYKGPTVKDLLTAAGVNLSDAAITGISVFAPDGFKTDFSITSITAAYPNNTFYDVNQASLAANLQFVTYPSPIPNNPATGAPFANADTITDLWLTIAYQRDGAAINTSYYDSVTGRLEGEGPYRIIPPQTPKTGTSRANGDGPDRGNGMTQASPDDGWNYISGLDHNAGSSARGMCIIRVNPMPAGYEEYDTSNGWSLITDKKIVVYGYGVH